MAVFFVFFGLLAQGCNPLAQGGTAGGKCELEDGSVVDTYNIYGSWKKISGYAEPRPPSELAHSFDVLLIQAGSPFCVVEVVSQATGDTLVKGEYTQNVSKKTVTFNSLIGVGAPSTAEATVVFSGSCNQTKMTLSYPNSDRDPEVYQVLSKDVASINCNPESDDGSGL